MKLELLHIKIHGFLSFGDAELDLADKGFCTITGINHDKADNAMSNGSGKSSLISAICWAITGETIQGLKSNIVNVNLNTGCFVELTFNLDNHLYKITRYKDDPTYKTDLKIIVDSEDKSGKGIRETQQLLSQMLPDINSDTIGSVIILGQGLPHKLSNNTPSGRKELLEKLSKSDFMIEDIKNRAREDLKTIILPEAEDIRVIKAAKKVVTQGFANIVLLGDEEKVFEICQKNNIDIEGVTIINPLKFHKKQEYIQKLYELRKTKGMTIEQAEELLKEVGLYSLRNELAINLPYGKQRRLEIARALAIQPKILYLDEPAAGMNPPETKELTELIDHIRSKYKLTVILIEHDMSLVMKICERIYVLNYGKMIANGTPEEIKHNEFVVKAYLGEEI